MTEDEINVGNTSKGRPWMMHKPVMAIIVYGTFVLLLAASIITHGYFYQRHSTKCAAVCEAAYPKEYRQVTKHSLVADTYDCGNSVFDASLTFEELTRCPK